MATKHLEIDDAAAVTKTDPNAPYGYKADGVTPKGRPGRKPVNVKPTIPDAAHAGPPLRRNSPRPVARPPTRELSREPSRQNATVVGRDGQELYRKRPESGVDLYDVVKAPSGWTYQWNPVTALNQEMDKIQLQMYDNGWRPVPSSRHPGIYTAPGHDGQIVSGGLRLEERPAALTKEALAEDELRARMRLRNETDALRLTQSQLPGANAGRAKQVSGIRVDIDRSLELPPDENYELEQ